MAEPPWPAVAALVDPVRRALYDHVRQQDHPVTREEAAEAIAISRTLTAFHLDKLVDAGLLRARYESPPDKRRGRGRTPKVYEPTDEGLTLTVPPRQYELVAEILAHAVAEQPTNARAAAQEHAATVGRHLGETSPAGERTGADAAAELSRAYSSLVDLGFEPDLDGTELTLGNCPFHTLAVRHTELVCDLNHALITGLLAGLGTDRLCAQLRPLPGGCCVRVTPSDPATP